jgi:magnesium transporter
MEDRRGRRGRALKSKCSPTSSRKWADEAADVLGDLEPQDRAAALAAMEPDDVQELTPLLIHSDESAGGLMTSEFLALRRRMTAGEALDVVRHWAPENEALYTLFVVDRDGVLVGVLSLRTLVTAPPDATLKDIMDPDVIHVATDTTPEECAQLMAHYDLLALPVIDAQHKLLGVITVDDLLEEE